METKNIQLTQLAANEVQNKQNTGDTSKHPYGNLFEELADIANDVILIREYVVDLLEKEPFVNEADANLISQIWESLDSASDGLLTLSYRRLSYTNK